MNLRIYFLVHGIALSLITLLPKAHKIWIYKSGGDINLYLELCLRDISLVIALELILLGIVHLLSKKLARFVAAAWGLALVPLAAFSIVEHRYFLSTGLFIDYNLLRYGLVHIDSMATAYWREAGLVWWILLTLSVPLGLLLGLWGYRVCVGMSRSHQQTGRPGVAMLGMGVVLLGAPHLRSSTDVEELTRQKLRHNALISVVLEVITERGDTVGSLPSSVSVQADGSLEIPDPPLLVRSAGKRPLNVVIVSLESVRANATTPYNRKLDTMPFLAEIAERGMKVENGYVLMAHTSKSLVAILCGYPPNMTFALPETSKGTLPPYCLPHLLRKHGYRTAFFQSANRSFENRAVLVENLGFEHFVSKRDLDHSGFETPNYFGLEERALLKPVMKWVDAQNEPFLLHVLTLMSHHDHKVPSTFEKKEYPSDRKHWSDYLNTLRYQDQFLRELLEHFQARKLDQNTIFVFVGDHGQAFKEHSLTGYGDVLYQEAAHIPIILYSPSMIEPSSVVQGTRSQLDIVPTMIDLLGFEIDKGGFWGRSFRQKVSDNGLSIACWNANKCFAHIVGGRKLIYHYNYARAELYDLLNDPREENDIIADLPKEDRERAISQMMAWKHGIRDFYRLHSEIRLRDVSFNPPEIEVSKQADFGGKVMLLGHDPVPELAIDKPGKFTVYFKSTGDTWYWRDELTIHNANGEKLKASIQSSITHRNPIYSWIPGQYITVTYDIVPQQTLSDNAYLRLVFKSSSGKAVPVTGQATDLEMRGVLFALSSSRGKSTTNSISAGKPLV